MSRNHYEHQQQAALFQWAKFHKSVYPQLKWLYAIPNGYSGDHTKIMIRGRLISKAAIQTNRMKDEGLTPGIWDIHLPEPVQQYHGLFIEMKSPGNKLTPEQEQFRNDKQHQYYFALCYDWIIARDTIILYLAGERF